MEMLFSDSRIINTRERKLGERSRCISATAAAAGQQHKQRRSEQRGDVGWNKWEQSRRGCVRADELARTQHLVRLQGRRHAQRGRPQQLGLPGRVDRAAERDRVTVLVLGADERRGDAGPYGPQLHEHGTHRGAPAPRKGPQRLRGYPHRDSGHGQNGTRRTVQSATGNETLLHQHGSQRHEL